MLKNYLFLTIGVLIILWLVVLISDIKILISETNIELPYTYELGQGKLGETTRSQLLCKYFNGRKILYRSYWYSEKDYCPFINKE